MKSYNQQLLTAWRADLTRTPEEIEREIDRERRKASDCIKFSMELTSDRRQRLKLPMLKTVKLNASSDSSKVTLCKYEEQYEKSRQRLSELEAELENSVKLRESAVL